jgi:transcriptional regulator with XRE-family HTH domain
VSDWFSEAKATFEDRMTSAREVQGMRREEVTRRLGVKVATIAAWEDDRSEPRANRLQMLAGLLNVSLMWLPTGRGEGVPAPDETGPVLSEEARAALTDLRLVRAGIERLSGRIGLAEKRLRRVARG